MRHLKIVSGVDENEFFNGQLCPLRLRKTDFPVQGRGVAVYLQEIEL
jgi:hypothetical protein